MFKLIAWMLHYCVGQSSELSAVCLPGKMLTWGVHEVKMDQVINAQFLELKHHRAKVGAENLGVSIVLHFVLVGFLWGGGREGGIGPLI